MKHSFPNIESVVLVSDSTSYIGDSLTVFNRDIDRPKKRYVNELKGLIENINLNVIYYDSPSDFQKNISKHSNDLVFPYWYGKNSRNRHSIVPAICEGAGIKYLGGDAYTKIVCNDKRLSKLLCEDAGLKTAKDFVYYNMEDNFLIKNITPPFVVKPLFEGTSLGISSKNKTSSRNDAIELANSIVKEFNQPAIIEEFVEGKEVSICIIGQPNNIKLINASERYIAGNEDYFIKNLYTFKEKKSEKIKLELRSVLDEVSIHLKKSCSKLFSMLGKVEYMRIDGKLLNGDFTVIELSPETHLGVDAEFIGTMLLNKNYTSEEIIRLMIQNSLEGYQN